LIISVCSRQTAFGSAPFTFPCSAGTSGLFEAGTSQASPHVAGVAALVRQAHPTWKKVEDLRAAIVNTANASKIAGFSIRMGGAGLVQPLPATQTSVVALGTRHRPSLNFGFEDLNHDFSKDQDIELRNFGATDATFTVGTAMAQGPAHSVDVPASVTVKAGQEVHVTATLNVALSALDSSTDFEDVAGFVTFTPAAGSNAGVSLAVPYYLVPRADSKVDAKLEPGKLKNGAGTLTVTNKGPAFGTADVYAWGLSDKNEHGKDGKNPADIRAAGVESFPNPSAAAPTRKLIVFAINGWDAWSTASTQEYDVLVDVNNDGKGNYIVLGVDSGAFETGTSNGILATYVYDLRTKTATRSAFGSAQPMNSSTVELPVRSTQLCAAGSPCLSDANPRFKYTLVVFDRLSDFADETDTWAGYNPWTPAITQGGFEELDPAASASEAVAVNPAEWALTPALGLMVVSLENKAGDDEASLVDVKVK